MAQPPDRNPGQPAPQGERIEVPPRLIDAIRQSRRSKVEHGQVRVWVEGPDGTTTTKVYAVPLSPEDLADFAVDVQAVSDASLNAEVERLDRLRAQAEAKAEALKALRASRGR